jgi:hypothetical protein
LIDKLLARKITVVENGISQRRTGFEIIFLQLSNKAAAGNNRALNVLVKYSDFAASRSPSPGPIAVLVEHDKKYPKIPRAKNE